MVSGTVCAVLLMVLGVSVVAIGAAAGWIAPIPLGGAAFGLGAGLLLTPEDPTFGQMGGWR